MLSDRDAVFEAFTSDMKDKILKSRQDAYGDAQENFLAASDIKRRLRVRDNRHGLQEAVDMIVSKLVRITHNPTHYDSWLDIAGYAALAAIIIHEEGQTDELT